jgi:uncharacterized protein YkwD
MRLSKIVLLAALVGLLGGIAAPAGARSGARLQQLKPSQRMQQATNRSRLSHGVHRVWLNARLSDLARKHSLAMASAGSLFHTTDPASYYLKGITWRVWGENVGVSGAGVYQMESAFMASPPHRANILRPSFAHSAVGAVWVRGQLWVTVFFYG